MLLTRGLTILATYCRCYITKFQTENNLHFNNIIIKYHTNIKEPKSGTRLYAGQAEL